MHSSVTDERIIDLVERCQTSTENLGLCIACGEERDGCEPDATNYKCESCGKYTVYGAEYLLIIHI